MATRSTFTAEVVQSGDWWAIDVIELPHVFSQARHLDDVEAMARDAISLCLEVDSSSFDVMVVAP